MTTTPRLTVVIPTYNMSRFLAKCIESILAQTFTDFELLVVDDGSTDNSAQIADRYAQQDARVRVLRCKHAGISTTRNQGIDHAAGRYLCYIDADDWVEPEFLAEFFRAQLADGYYLYAQRVAIDYSEFTGAIPDTKLLFESGDDLIRPQESEKAVRYKLLQIGAAPGKMYDMELIRRHALRYHDGLTTWDDTTFIFEYLLHIDAVALSSGEYYHYMRRGDGNSLSEKLHSAVQTLRAVKLFDALIPPLLQRYRITDRQALECLYTDCILLPLMRAAQVMTIGNHRQVMRAIASHKAVFEALKFTPPSDFYLSKKALRWLFRLPAALYLIPFSLTRIRKYKRQRKQ